MLLGLGHVLADLPEGLTLGVAFGESRVDDQAVLHGLTENALDRVTQSGAALRTEGFRQDIPVVALRKRVAVAGNVGVDEIQYGAIDEFEGSHGVAGARAHPGQEFDRRRRIAHGDERGLDRAWPWEKFEDSRGDDAKRTLGADEQLLEVVAGVVLAQSSEAAPDLAIREHDLEPEHEIARHAVAQHLDPAGVGRKIAADLAAPLRREAQREEPVGVLRRLLDGLQDAACLHRDREVERVEAAHRVHPLERQEDAARVSRPRDRSADEASIAALRDDRDPRQGADPHAARDLRRRSRSRHEQGRAAIGAAPVDQIARHRAGVLEIAFRPEDLLELDDGFEVGHATRSLADGVGVTGGDVTVARRPFRADR